jgi:AraC-like DNA-binding protein
LCKQVSPLANSTSFALVLAALREIALQKGQINNLTARVSEALDGVTRGRIDAVEVARTMGMSKRTFERRLSGEGTNFRDLLNESYKKRLEHLLLDTRLTAEAIAERLGYHDASSLLRSCRRLYGIPYSQLRREVRAKQAK